MNLHVPSPAEITARRARLMGSGRVVNLAVKPKEQQPKRPDSPADAHVKAYREFMAKVAECPSASSYVRMRCKMSDLPHAKIVDPKIRAYPVVVARRQLIREVKARYPQMSSVRIGWLFGGLHHSAVLDAFKGEAPRWQGIPADKVEEIKRLRSKGLTYPQIAEAAGVNRTTVQKYLNPGLRERENLRRRERAKR